MYKFGIFRKLLFIVLFCIIILTYNVGHTNEKPNSVKEELVFLNWSEYMDPDLIKEFEDKFNAHVKQIYFETDELKDEMLLETNGTGYDVVLGSGISIIPYIKRKWLTPLDDGNIPNIKYIDSRWLKAHEKIEGFAVPYLWGTVGIAFRKDLVQEKIFSWKQLFKPAEYLRGKILMINDSRDTIGAALKALGYSLNSEDFQQYNEAEHLLLSQKPFVKAYSYITLTEESALITGKAFMAMVYNGDALFLQENHPNIAFTVPEEGTSLWIDYLMVMQASKHKKLAMDFVNFLSEPQNAARLSSFLMFATPNKAAEKFLTPDHLNNPLIYPSKGVIEKSEFSRELAPRILKKRNSIFSNLIK